MLLWLLYGFHELWAPPKNHGQLPSTKMPEIISGRVPIGSCDFSLYNWSCGEIKEDDWDLKGFSIKRYEDLGTCRFLLGNLELQISPKRKRCQNVRMLFFSLKFLVPFPKLAVFYHPIRRPLGEDVACHLLNISTRKPSFQCYVPHLSTLSLNSWCAHSFFAQGSGRMCGRIKAGKRSPNVSKNKEESQKYTENR